MTQKSPSPTLMCEWHSIARGGRSRGGAGGGGGTPGGGGGGGGAGCVCASATRDASCAERMRDAPLTAGRVKALYVDAKARSPKSSPIIVGGERGGRWTVRGGRCGQAGRRVGGCEGRVAARTGVVRPLTRHAYIDAYMHTCGLSRLLAAPPPAAHPSPSLLGFSLYARAAGALPAWQLALPHSTPAAARCRRNHCEM